MFPEFGASEQRVNEGVIIASDAVVCAKLVGPSACNNAVLE